MEGINFRRAILNLCRFSATTITPLDLSAVVSYHGYVPEIFPLQEQVNFGKFRPVRVAALPAFGHDLVHFAGTTGRWFHVHVFAVCQVHVVGILNYLFVGELCQWLMAAEHQYLPQGDCERPDVAFRRVLALKSHTNDLFFFILYSQIVHSGAVRFTRSAGDKFAQKGKERIYGFDGISRIY